LVAKLSLKDGAGRNRLKIASSGKMTFATGQTFAGVAQLNAANDFTANQTVNGNVTASGSLSPRRRPARRR
jgi:hypothetical protein